MYNNKICGNLTKCTKITVDVPGGFIARLTHIAAIPSKYVLYIVLYCIVLKGWSLLPNVLQPFQDLLCSPNLGIIRT